MFSHSKKLSIFTNIGSIFTITIIGSTPWLLFNQKPELAIIAPISLFVAFLFHDQYQQKDTKKKYLFYV